MSAQGSKTARPPASRKSRKKQRTSEDEGGREQSAPSDCHLDAEGERERAEAAAKKAALHLCQARGEDRDEAAAQKALERLGCTHRLADCVLRYKWPPPPPTPSTAHKPFVQAWDSALPPSHLQLMQDAFARSSPFWAEHSYSVEPPSPYFSYVHVLPRPGKKESAEHPATGLDDVIAHIHQSVCRRFPRCKKARYAEWWTHCRPHNSGHQFHFDSANEGIGGVRNPIVSTVTFLEATVGGPTIVTDQLFGEPRLAQRGWAVHPEENRCVAFDGRYLHGVVPGWGHRMGLKRRRITFMVAFWRDDVRLMKSPATDGLPGSAMQFPAARKHPDKQWLQLVAPRPAAPETAGFLGVDVPPCDLAAVWERVDGGKIGEELPGYEQCFQGF